METAEVSQLELSQPEFPQLELGTVACPHCGARIERGAFACPDCHHTTLPTRRKWRAGDGRVFALSLAIALVVHNSPLVARVLGGICELTGNYQVALWCARYDLRCAQEYYGPQFMCGTCKMQIIHEYCVPVARIERKLSEIVDLEPPLE